MAYYHAIDLGDEVLIPAVTDVDGSVRTDLSYEETLLLVNDANLGRPGRVWNERYKAREAREKAKAAKAAR